jgi:hypothetical protein
VTRASGSSGLVGLLPSASTTTRSIPRQPRHIEIGRFCSLPSSSARRVLSGTPRRGLPLPSIGRPSSISSSSVSVAAGAAPLEPRLPSAPCPSDSPSDSTFCGWALPPLAPQLSSSSSSSDSSESWTRWRVFSRACLTARSTAFSRLSRQCLRAASLPTNSSASSMSRSIPWRTG